MRVIMSTPASKDSALLVHIEHSKPIEMDEFVSSLNALNNLYSSYVRKNGQFQAISKSKLYIEKIEEGCIDIYLCELASATIFPFIENANVLFEFAGYLKGIYSFFKTGEGNKPSLETQECKNLSDMLNIVVSDQKGTLTIGAVNKAENGNVYNGCTFNFGEGSGVQRLLGKEIDTLKAESPTENIYKRVLMQIYQVRNEANKNEGNKAIIDEIFKGRKVGVVFETDELKNAILFSDINPTQKAFWVDVEVLTVDGKPKAYNVTALHDIIDIDE